MTAKDLAELHEILHAALTMMAESADLPDDPEELQVQEILTSCSHFKNFVLCGVDDHLVETNNSPISRTGDAQAELDRVIHMTIQQLASLSHILISLGMDLGIYMARMGAKFPGAKTN